MENLHPPTGQDQRQFIALLMFSLVLSSVFLLFEENLEDLKRVTPPGRAHLVVKVDEAGRAWAKPVRESGPPALSNIAVNVAPMEELVLCPGIGPVFADKIVTERSARPFQSWDDLARRLPGFGRARLEALQAAGVQLDEKK